jgi:ATP-binding cassette subfamily B protein
MGKKKLTEEIKIFLYLISLEEKNAKLIIFLKGFFSALLPFFNLFFYVRIINQVISKEYTQCVWNIGILLLGTFIIEMIEMACEQWLDYLKETCTKTLDKHIAFKAYTMPYEDLERQETMDSLRRTNNFAMGSGGLETQIDTLVQIINRILSIIYSIYFLVVLFTKVDTVHKSFLTSHGSTVLMLLLYFCIVIVGFLFAGNVQKIFSELLIKNDHVNSVTSYLSNLMTNQKNAMSIRINNMQDAFDSLLKKYNKESLGSYHLAGKKSGKNYGIVALLGQIAVATSYIFVGAKALRGVIDIGDVFLYTGAINIAMGAFSELIPKISGFLYRSSYLKLYYEFLQKESVPTENHNNQISEINANKFDIEFRDVSFRYPGSDNMVLKQFNMKIRAGEKMAIVGRNGAGKTTIVKLLCLLYKPTEGEILINGVNINNYTYSEYIRLISVVFQDFKLFSLPLDQNIAGGKEIDNSKVSNVIGKVNLSNKIENMYDNIHSQLFNNNGDGIELSGGEAQKVAIARALYKNSNFVILDEPTAALDPIAESEIYQQFDTLIEGKSAIYISHRMSSCKFCDEILVLDKGKLIESGDHSKLMQEKGIYYELYNTQAQYYCD